MALRWSVPRTDAVLGEPELLSDDAYVYRVLKNKKCIDSEGRPTELAFRLRPGEADGLSVGLTYDYAQTVLDRPAGIAAIRVGDIRALKRGSIAIDVMEDAEVVGHALIVGIPVDDVASQIAIASALSGKAKRCEGPIVG